MRILLILLFPLSLLAQSRSLPVAKTSGGMVSGTFNSDKTVSIYKGVPFAAPPVGEWRWMEPQPVKPWKGTLTCDKFPASPIQNTPVPFRMWSQEFITPAEPLSEDCLYLNVWTSAKSSKEKQPVLVWIHGGAFTSGSGACPIYDGEALAKEGVVYVSINYRLGIFGFLAHHELSEESKHHASGNYGLLDQIAALQWVKENIAAFGGDPDKVTIAGQSAGSMSVQALVASPLAKGLFRSAIAQSGASFNRMSKELIEAEKVGEALSQKTGATLQKLRRMNADSLLVLGNSFPFGSFSPIADGYVIPEKLRTIFETKKHNDVLLMAGWVTGDGALLGPSLSQEKFIASAEAKYGDKKDEFLKVFPVGTEDEAIQSQSKLGMIQFASLPDHEWALLNSSKSYMYQFSYVPTDKPGFPNYGAFHTSEVPFALHTLKYWDRPWTAQDYQVEKYMSSYWINFVKTGNPNGNNLPDWKAYDANVQGIMEFGKEPVMQDGLLKKELQFLKSVE